ncbi:MAG: Vitamin B12 dependent methionine synthase activation subunit [Candidatus Ruminococcus intestinipullorum]|nr:Vitamin B12 dependent methionine synthase activation subunit [Candidatus Ruminococcus intestinipullorum]
MDRMTKEAIRYLGYGNHAVDEQTLQLLLNSFQDLKGVAEPKSIYRIFQLEQMDDESFKIGEFEFQSHSLGRNLKGCDKIILFGATLGIGVDRLLRRVSLTDMAKAVVLQACAAAMLEEYCDKCQEELGKEMAQEGRYLRPRFSPGYGDFDIAYQKNLMGMLECSKKIGLTMTESYMMTPTKSVTAVIGASTRKEHCPIQGCEVCNKMDCEYRRGTR